MGDRILPLPATQNASGRSAMLEHHDTRKEVARRERVAAEQRRRNELRNSYENLRKVLPPSKQKNSKISLVHRATSHISSIDEENKLLQDRIVMLELEIQQLTNLLKGSVGGGAKASH
ncbi:hypothetical protein B0H14DRAFT_317115 [Mycena olivaceomarginata]|nr:hypothetical protein B0H14DRAFT_317115 [Mycena olivaceomarginata]